MGPAEFGKQLQERRKAISTRLAKSGRGTLSQARFMEEVADIVGSPKWGGKVQLSRWENGRRTIDPQERGLLMAILQVLHELGGGLSVEEANALLAAGGYAPLSSAETDQLQMSRSSAPPSSTVPVPPTRVKANLPAPTQAFGFDRVLNDVARTLKRSRTNTLFLTGLGGAGKTLLATQVAHRMVIAKRVVLFIPVASSTILSANDLYVLFLRALWEEICSRSSGQHETSVIERELYQLLSQHDYVVIVDGLLTNLQANTFAARLSTLGNRPRFLVTSRFRPKTGVPAISVNDLPFAFALRVLNDQLALYEPAPAQEQLDQLTTVIGGNPLALMTAAGAIRRGFPVHLLISAIEQGKSLAFDEIYTTIFDAVWQTLSEADQAVAFAYLVEAQQTITPKRLSAIVGLPDEYELVPRAMELVGCAFLVPSKQGYLIQTLVRHFVRLKAQEVAYRPKIIALSHNAIRDWLARLKQTDDIHLHTIDRIRQSLFQTMRVAVPLIPDADNEFHTDLVLLARATYRFVLRRGYMLEWLPLLRQLVDALPFRDDAHHCRLLLNVALVARFAREIDVASQACLEALRISQQLESDEEMLNSFFNLGVCLELKDDIPQARMFAMRGLTLAQALQSDYGIGMCENLLGKIAWRLGEFEAAIEHYKTAARHLEKCDAFAETARFLNNLAHAYADFGWGSLAFETFAEAEYLLSREPDEQIRANIIHSRIEALIKVGLIDQVEKEITNRFERRLRRMGNRFLLASFLRCRGHVMLLRQRVNPAIEILQESKQLWRELHYPVDEARTVQLLLQAHVQEDRFDLARICFAEITMCLRGKEQFYQAKTILDEIESYRAQLF